MNTENWLAGPVAITGADGHVGRALQGRLATLSNPIRTLGRSDDWTSASYSSGGNLAAEATQQLPGRQY